MPTRQADILRQVANVVALAAVIVMNALANTLPLFGRTTGDISDRFPVLFVPAGYVFGIWALIYLGLVAFAAYQARPSERANPRLRAVGYLFVVSCAANIGWLLAWHALMLPLSLGVMMVLLGSLLLIYKRLGIGREEVPVGETWFVRLPFSLYLGWISVATIANASTVLYDAGWGGWGLPDPVWTVIMLTVATAIGIRMLLTRRDLVFNLVLVWAFIGIYVAQRQEPLVAGWALAAAGVLVALVLLTSIRPPSSFAGRLQGESS